MTSKGNNWVMQIYSDKDGHFCRIELTRGKYAKVDPSDYEWLSQYKWHTVSDMRGREEAVTKIKGKEVKMHRLILGLVSGVLTDHKNHNSLDNRRFNLRVATRSENQHNRRVTGRGSSRFKGVTWHKKTKYWMARICYERVLIFLGCFRKRIVGGVDFGEIAAANSYDKAAIKYFGSFACLNFPD